MKISVPERIKEFNAGRIERFLQMKYKLMAQSSFRFYRGSCHLFYQDIHKHKYFHQFPRAWICGDLHLENFGSFKGDNRLVYFDLNDFDEAILGPVSFDILRITTSIYLGSEDLRLKISEANAVAKYFLSQFALILSKGKPRYIEVETAKGVVKHFLMDATARKQKLLVQQRTTIKKNKLSLLIDEKRLFPIEKKLKKQLLRHIQTVLARKARSKYKHKAIDVAFRVAGNGSLGLVRFEILVEVGKTPKKYFLLDMKEAKNSCIQQLSSIRQPNWLSNAERIIEIQERMQNVSPAVLSATRFKGKSFVIKEMQPVADKIDFLKIKSIAEIKLVVYDMALLAASAHLRSSGRQGAATAEDLIAFANDSKWQRSFLDRSRKYASKVNMDYQSFLKAYQSGFFK